jgi:hypothetical protein
LLPDGHELHQLVPYMHAMMMMQQLSILAATTRN